MKKLLLVLMLLSGCCDSSHIVKTDVNTLKFKAGDKVVTVRGFYSDCYGIVEQHSRFQYEFDGPSYDVTFYCPNLGWLKEYVTISESNLTKKEK